MDQPRDITDLAAIRRLRKKQQDLLKVFEYSELLEAGSQQDQEKVAEELLKQDD